ncbi:TPA: hypothetical protein ACF238_004130 [Klebsiella quasipneumoniae subsp. similipneumoniae]
MTITLQAVNELIASLESAGELSIREQKFLKLAKAFKQLAAENVALKQAEFNLVRNIINDLGDTEFQYARVQTPATDRIVAGIKADGVEAFAAYCGEENSIFVEAKAYYRSLPDAAYEFCSMLRENKSEGVKS